MAVRVRFELTDPVKGQRFSRPPHSTTLPPHRTFSLPHHSPFLITHSSTIDPRPEQPPSISLKPTPSNPNSPHHTPLPPIQLPHPADDPPPGAALHPPSNGNDGARAAWEMRPPQTPCSSNDHSPKTPSTLFPRAPAESA